MACVPSGSCVSLQLSFSAWALCPPSPAPCRSQQMLRCSGGSLKQLHEAAGIAYTALAAEYGEASLVIG